MTAVRYAKSSVDKYLKRAMAHEGSAFRYLLHANQMLASLDYHFGPLGCQAASISTFGASRPTAAISSILNSRPSTTRSVPSSSCANLGVKHQPNPPAKQSSATLPSLSPPTLELFAPNDPPGSWADICRCKVAAYLTLVISKLEGAVIVASNTCKLCKSANLI